MKWYYISHPYTGNEEENRKKAADVQRHLHEMYADIVCINPLAMFAPLAALSYEKIMTYCLEVMQPADAVIMCRGYEKSRGCMREYEAAKQEGRVHARSVADRRARILAQQWRSAAHQR